MANAVTLLGAQQPGGAFAGGAGTLQEYAALALKHAAANDRPWIQNYNPAGKVSECKAVSFPPYGPEWQ